MVSILRFVLLHKDKQITVFSLAELWEVTLKKLVSNIFANF